MGAAHRREALDLVDVGDRHDAGQDGHLDARGPRPAQELEIAPVVEEQLGDEEVRPRVHLGLAVPQVLDEVARLRMALRIAGRADAELDAVLVRDLPRERHQIGGVREPVGVGDELALAARRIAPEREHVADPGIADDAELLLQLLARDAHAGEVGHGLDLGVALDARHHLQRAPARQVTLTYEGPSGRRARSDSNSEATPASFFGGKNSNEKTGSPRSAAKRIMSVILIGAGSPRPPLRSRPTPDAACDAACGASRPGRSPATPARPTPRRPTRPNRERRTGWSIPPA